MCDENCPGCSRVFCGVKEGETLIEYMDRRYPEIMKKAREEIYGTETQVEDSERGRRRNR